MNPHRSRPASKRRFSSERIVLLLGGALATTAAFGLSGCADDDPPEPAPGPQTRIISQAQLTQDLQRDREEENNSYVPGLGYYHALHHSWFPYPFDYYYPGIGYYRGGVWNQTRYSGLVLPLHSKPHWKTVTDDQPGSANAPGGAHGFSGSGGYGSFSHEGGISRGIFTAPHSSGFHAGFGGHFGGS